MRATPLFVALTRPVMRGGIPLSHWLFVAITTGMTAIFAGDLPRGRWIIAGTFAVSWSLMRWIVAKDLNLPRTVAVKWLRTPPHLNGNWWHWRANSYEPGESQMKIGFVRKLLLKHGMLVDREKMVADHIPLMRFVTPEAFVTKDGDVGSVIRVTGVSHGTMDDWQIEEARNVVARCLYMVGREERTAFYFHTIKRKLRADALPKPVTHPPIAAEIDRLYHRTFEDRSLYAIEHYLTILRAPPAAVVKRAGKYLGWLFFWRRKAQAEPAPPRELELRKLGETVQKAVDALGRFTPIPLSKDDSDHPEILGFMSMLVNGAWRPPKRVHGALDRVLPSTRFGFHSELFSMTGADPNDNRVGAMLRVKEYAHYTKPSSFDQLLSAPGEFIVTQTFVPIAQGDASALVKDKSDRMLQAEDDAVTLREDLVEARSELASGKMMLGTHHCSIAVLAKDSDALTDHISDCLSRINASDMMPMRETLGMEALWWAQIPGNFPYRLRTARITHQNMADLAPFHTHPRGEVYRLPWGAPITTFETAAGTPYAFSFHAPGRPPEEGKETDAKKAHTMVFGPTDSGKTTLMNFLMSQTCRLALAPRIIWFDNKRGAEAMIRSHGGLYHLVQPDRDPIFNPLHHCEDAAGQAWLSGFIERLYGKTFSPLQLAEVHAAVRQNAEAPRGLQTLSHFATMFDALDDDGDLNDHLGQWLNGGRRGWIFDNAEDRVSFDAPMIGFDFTELISDKVSTGAIFHYLFHRVERLLVEGYPTIIVIDEGWQMLDDEYFADHLKRWLKTVRSKNAVVVFMTQEVADATASKVHSTILENCETEIFFGNSAASETVYRDDLRLSETELGFIREITPEARTMLIRKGGRSVLARCDLSMLGDYLKVLTSTSETSIELDALVEAHGDDWLQHYTRTYKEAAE